MENDFARSLDYATASENFESKIIAATQNKEKLMGTCNEITDADGIATHFPISNTLELNKYGLPDDGNLAVSRLEVDQVIVNRDTFYLKTVVNKSRTTFFSYNEVQRHIDAHSKALARWKDAIKLDALYDMYSGGTLREAFYTIPKATGIHSGLNVDKISDALDFMMDQGVDDEDNINLWANARLRQGLKADPKFNSWDYNVKRPLMNDNVTGFLGVAFVWLGSIGKSSIPLFDTTKGTYKIPLVHRDSIYVVYNEMPNSYLWWNGGERRYEFITTATAGSIAIPNGIAEGSRTKYPGIVMIECDIQPSPSVGFANKLKAKEK